MPIYFIRHGESEANERNQFAGRQDSPLTRLGIEQAKQAGQAIARKQLIFDEIHVSPLQRARFTAQKIITMSGNSAARVSVSQALIERHFGFLQGRNKSLWKKVLGYRLYDELLHSSRNAPQGGETWQDMYSRVRSYYEQVLLPVSQSGRTILVVAHKYIIEMFALIIADLAPEDYCDFKIPNSRPSSESDLRYLATHVPRSVNTLGELVEIHLPLLMLCCAVLGVLLKMITNWSLSPLTFMVGAILCQVVNIFFGFLYADPSRLIGLDRSLKDIWMSLLIRLSLGLGLTLFAPNILLQLLGTFLLLPSATIVPSLVLLWEGDYPVALRVTLFLSTLSLFLLAASTIFPRSIGFFSLQKPPIQLQTLLILAVVLILPVTVAQWYRLKQPMKAGALSTNWGWVGGAASLPLALLTTSYFTPVFLLKQLMTDQGILLLSCTFFLMVGAFGGLSLIAQLVNRGGLEDETGNACYLAITTPNIFFWSAIIAPLATSSRGPLISMLVMWSLLIFFGKLVFQEKLIIRQTLERTVCSFVQQETYSTEKVEIMSQMEQLSLNSSVVPTRRQFVSPGFIDASYKEVPLIY